MTEKKEMTFEDFLNALELYGREVLLVKREHPDLTEEQALDLLKTIVKAMAVARGIK